MPGTHQIYGIKALQRNLFLKQLINIYPTAGWSLLLFDTPYFLFTTTSGLKRKLKCINWGFYEAQNDSCIVIYSVRSKAGWELGRTTEKQYARTEDVQENLNRSSASLFSSRYKQGPTVWRCTALPRHTSRGGHSGTQPGDPARGHRDGQQGGRSIDTALTAHWSTDCIDTATPDTQTQYRGRDNSRPANVGERTEDGMSLCLLCVELQSLPIPFCQPSTGLCPTVSHSRYWQTLADLGNREEHFHTYTDSSKPLLLGSASSNCHLRWVPVYKMPMPTVSNVGVSLPRPHPKRKSRSYGKMVGYEGAGSTPPASGLTVPPALPWYKPVPGAGLHQGIGDRSRALPVVLFPRRTYREAEAHAEGTSTGHLPQSSQMTSDMLLTVFVCLFLLCEELLSLPRCKCRWEAASISSDLSDLKEPNRESV